MIRRFRSNIIETILASFPHGLASMVAAQSVSLFVGLVVYVIAIRSLDATEFMRFVILNTVGSCFQVFFVSGIPFSLRKSVSLDPMAARSCVFLIVRKHVPFCLGVVLAWVVVALLWSSKTPDLSWFFASSCLALEVLLRSGILDPCLQLLNGLRHYALQGFVIAVYQVCRLTCFGAFIATSSLVSGMLGLALAAAIGTCVSALSIWWVLRIEGFQVQVPNHMACSAWHGNGLGFEFLCFCYSSCWVWLAPWCIDDDYPFVALYATCFALSRGILAAGLSLSASGFSSITASLANRDYGESQKSIRKALGCLLVFLVPTVFLVWRRDEMFLSWFCGKDVVDPRRLLAWTWTGFCVYTMFIYVGDMLGAAGKIKTRLAFVSIMVLLNVGVICADRRGEFAAWAFAIITSCGFFAALFAMTKVTGFVFPTGIAVRSIIAACPLAFSPLPRHGISWLPQIAMIIPEVLFYATILCFVSVLLRLENRNEFRWLSSRDDW